MTSPRETASPAAAPPTPPTSPSPLARAATGMEDYHRIADTIGGVPNLRWKDNLFQMVCVAVFALIGGGAGLLFITVKEWPWWIRGGVGLMGGLVAGTLLSGIVLMILGWIRSAGSRDARVTR